ncbi:DUF3185 family protein [Pelagicoccus sp. NFK12]|uniref:DUF3185 family protein n=1 Tax=Pelagicoccus enzymogenes TaxID=2773457 RepID=A0A927FC73_9BACT|nr:DUF3185 family protein [Pelagicoccus enzymogenes]MBD5782332.1 DUF3185 family protein [Pelagicoccus enzymogenes]MDQ8199248.1 DUF3185 family protein [Pelagicoccus enzymogenes]
MKKPLSLSLVVIGIILLAYGFSAADSISSSFSRLFTGSPSEKAIWLQLGGAVCLILGITRLFRGK